MEIKYDDDDDDDDDEHAAVCMGRVYPRFRTCVFKSHLLLSVWPVLVEFRSACSEGSGRK